MTFVETVSLFLSPFPVVLNKPLFAHLFDVVIVPIFLDKVAKLVLSAVRRNSSLQYCFDSGHNAVKKICKLNFAANLEPNILVVLPAEQLQLCIDFIGRTICSHRKPMVYAVVCDTDRIDFVGFRFSQSRCAIFFHYVGIYNNGKNTC